MESLQYKSWRRIDKRNRFKCIKRGLSAKIVQGEKMPLLLLSSLQHIERQHLEKNLAMPLSTAAAYLNGMASTDSSWANIR
jgi:hypothetical protein